VAATGLAEDVYRAIDANGGNIADAMHAATRTLRDQWFDLPSVWASPVHVGV
jgi:hypothetical protein